MCAGSTACGSHNLFDIGGKIRIQHGCLAESSTILSIVKNRTPSRVCK